MFCPWASQVCPGEENCVPAALSPKRDEEGKLAPFCPITAVVESFEYIAMVVTPILENAGLVKQPIDPQKDRDRWLRERVKPDQDL